MAKDKDSSKKLLQLIKLPEVSNVAGISKSEIFRRMKTGDFPQPIRLGNGRCTRWEMGEVQAWIKKQLAERVI